MKMWLCYVFCFLFTLTNCTPHTLNKDGLIISEDAFRGAAHLAKRELRPCEDCGGFATYTGEGVATEDDDQDGSEELWGDPCQAGRQYRRNNIKIYASRCCGERNELPRVVGGTESDINEFPWLGRLIYYKSFGCAASLINDRFVVSAAHCLKGFMWFLFKVTFGEHDRCNASKVPETRYIVKMIVNDFTLTELSNDIALLMLSQPLQYSHAVKPVCLPKNDDKLYTGTMAVVAGWGATKENEKWSCTLLEAELPILSNEECRNTNYNASKIKDVMMCAGYPDTAHKDACTGDSGGPLIAENDEHMYDLIGIVSWGYGCARKGYPGVFTRVTKYLDWIRDNTPEACYCKY